MSVNSEFEQQDRPAYVRFETRTEEDVEASKKQGRYIAKDVDFALITPPYSMDCVEMKVDTWKRNMDQNVKNERIPAKWRDQWLESYDAWKKGQEIPLDGTPIRGWGMISPSMQENLIRMNIRTVEDLSGVNDEGMRRIGMGAVDLKNKAKAWLKSHKDHGGLVSENAALKKKIKQLEGSLVATNERYIELLSEAKELNNKKMGKIIEAEIKANEEAVA